MGYRPTYTGRSTLMEYRPTYTGSTLMGYRPTYRVQDGRIWPYALHTGSRTAVYGHMALYTGCIRSQMAIWPYIQGVIGLRWPYGPVYRVLDSLQASWTALQASLTAPRTLLLPVRVRGEGGVQGWCQGGYIERYPGRYLWRTPSAYYLRPGHFPASWLPSWPLSGLLTASWT